MLFSWKSIFFGQVVENDRQRLLTVERFILESICFNFTSRLPFPYVIKIGRILGGEVLIWYRRPSSQTYITATKLLTKFAWRLVMDWCVAISKPGHKLSNQRQLSHVPASTISASFCRARRTFCRMLFVIFRATQFRWSREADRGRDNPEAEKERWLGKKIPDTSRRYRR